MRHLLYITTTAYSFASNKANVDKFSAIVIIMFISFYSQVKSTVTGAPRANTATAITANASTASARPDTVIVIDNHPSSGM